MTQDDIATRAQTAAVDRRAAVNAALERAFATVPGPSPDAGLDMVEQLLAATTIDELDRPWNSNGLSDYLDRVVRITGMHTQPSDFKDGAGFFVVAQGVDTSTGEAVSFTTSSVYVMTQLAVAHNNGLFPLDVIPRQAAKPTEAGYYPQHLEVYRGGPAAPAGRPAGGAPRGTGQERGQQLRDAVRTAREHGAARTEAPAAPAPETGPGF